MAPRSKARESVVFSGLGWKGPLKKRLLFRYIGVSSGEIDAWDDSGELIQHSGASDTAQTLDDVKR